MIQVITISFLLCLGEKTACVFVLSFYGLPFTQANFGVSIEIQANPTDFTGNLLTIHWLYPSSKRGRQPPASKLQHIYQTPPQSIDSGVPISLGKRWQAIKIRWVLVTLLHAALICFSMAIRTGDFQDTKCPTFYTSSIQFFCQLFIAYTQTWGFRKYTCFRFSLLNICGCFNSTAKKMYRLEYEIYSLINCLSACIDSICKLAYAVYGACNCGQKIKATHS